MPLGGFIWFLVGSAWAVSSTAFLDVMPDAPVAVSGWFLYSFFALLVLSVVVPVIFYERLIKERGLGKSSKVWFAIGFTVGFAIWVALGSLR